MQIEMRKPSDLIPYVNNPRKNDGAAVDKVASSIKNFGFKVPIVVDASGEIVAGHTRHKAALKLGLDEVPVVVASDLTPAQIKAFRIADNRVAAESEWDFELLEIELEGLDGFSVEDLGFDVGELDFDIDKPDEVVEDDFDVEAELEKPAVAQRGQIWQLGRHRLMCGDSTTDDVDTLMDGKKADMLFTDPPYGVNYTGGHFHSGDVNIKREREKLAADETTAIYGAFLPVVLPYVEGPCYMWFASSKSRDVYNALYDNNTEIHASIIWHKTNATYAAMNAQYKQRHEPCIYFKRKGKTLKWSGATTEATIWELKKDGKNEFHPTQKPISLAAKAIKNHSVGLILDVFGGSGSTLMACEQTNRTCYMMELDEKYCDVIINRWEQFTGEKAVLIGGETDGEG